MQKVIMLFPALQRGTLQTNVIAMSLNNVSELWFENLLKYLFRSIAVWL
jgi:hypothetical protein